MVGRELAGLVHRRIQPGERDQLLRRVEALDVPDLAEDRRGEHQPDARDGHQVVARRQLLEQRGEVAIDDADLLLKERHLGQQTLHLDLGGIRQERNAQRLGGDLLDLPRLGRAKASPAGRLQQLGEFGQVKGGDGLGSRRFRQEGARPLAEDVTEERLVLGKYPVEDAQEFAFEVADLVDQREAKATQLAQLQDGFAGNVGCATTADPQQVGDDPGVPGVRLRLA
jgi:hypothetical protein